jgi:hypothetical protein
VTASDVALDVLLLLAFLLVAWRAYSRPEHRPLAFLLALWFVTTLLRRWLRLDVFEPRRAALAASGIDPTSVPLAGILRAARHLSDACTLIWGWGLVAVAVAALLPGWLRARWVAIPYALSLLVLVLGYPALRYHPLAVGLFVIQGVKVAALAAVVLVWLRRRPASVAPSRLQGLVLVLAVLHLALTVPMGIMALPLPPHPGAPTPNPFADWYLAQGQFAVMYVVIILAMVVPARKKSGSGNGHANGGNGSA